MRTARTPKKREKFLAALSELGHVTLACKAVGIGRTQAYEWRKRDAAFSKGWDEAIDVATELLEIECRRRAAVGTEETVYHRGLACGTIRKYSDLLLIFLLKAMKPEKYRDSYEHFHNVPSVSGAEEARKRVAAKLDCLAAQIAQPDGH
jgi:hypothetical protein